MDTFSLGFLMKMCYFCKEFAKMGCTRQSSNMFGSALICTILAPKIKKDMATQEQIEALKIDENVFE